MMFICIYIYIYQYAGQGKHQQEPNGRIVKMDLALFISLSLTRNLSKQQIWDFIKNITDFFPRCF